MVKIDKQAIVAAIKAAEAGTSGEIRVHLVKRCGVDALTEAKKVFSRLKMHKTKLRNGVLILICIESRRFAIYGDQGIYEKTGHDFWDKTRDTMLEYLKEGHLKDGIIAGVASAGEQLKHFFPIAGQNPNELSDTITQS